MTEFIHAQLAFHARAMEIYTAAYQQAQNIKEEEIVEVSRSIIPFIQPRAHPIMMCPQQA